ncbi:spore coat protein [Ectobacillus funiculus]|jgi:similar to spore coat protein|uniref:spore coat protein n=1 Tax=Ectobacillus funiculus TaxID=137993 RepID=UPI00397BCA68
MNKKQLSFIDHVIATDMLFETKAAIKDFAAAITEASSPEIHTFYHKELQKAITQHEQIYGFLQNRGIYDAYNVPEQLQKDISYAAEALQQ